METSGTALPPKVRRLVQPVVDTNCPCGGTIEAEVHAVELYSIDEVHEDTVELGELQEAFEETDIEYRCNKCQEKFVLRLGWFVPDETEDTVDLRDENFRLRQELSQLQQLLTEMRAR